MSLSNQCFLSNSGTHPLTTSARTSVDRHHTTLSRQILSNFSGGDSSANEYIALFLGQAVGRCAASECGPLALETAGFLARDAATFSNGNSDVCENGDGGAGSFWRPDYTVSYPHRCILVVHIELFPRQVSHSK